MNNHNPLSPHGGIFRLQWEIHERLPDGRYVGNSVKKKSLVFHVQGKDLALTESLVDTLVEKIKQCVKEVSNDAEYREESSQAFPQMFGMRGGIGGNSGV